MMQEVAADQIQTVINLPIRPDQIIESVVSSSPAEGWAGLQKHPVVQGAKSTIVKCPQGKCADVS